MAKPQVTLTFAGDSKKLEQAFARVGASSKDMSREVRATSAPLRDVGSSFDRVGVAADGVDTRAMGFRDTITGVQDTMRGFSDESLSLGDRLLMLGMGVGDLASGMFNFLVPSLKNSVLWIKNTTFAQNALNLAMRLNPIGLIITALVAVGAALVVAYQKSETFRRIVDGAFRAVQHAAAFAFNWVRNNWPILLAIITGPIGLAVLAVAKNFDKIKSFAQSAVNGVKSVFHGVGSAIVAPFRSAVQGIRNAWNSTLGGRGFDTPSWLPFGLGGKSFRIPRLHTGGIMPGTPGSEGLALLQAGERVTPAGQAGGPMVLELRSSGTALDDLLVEILARAVRSRGGDVQLVLGAV